MLPQELFLLDEEIHLPVKARAINVTDPSMQVGQLLSINYR